MNRFDDIEHPILTKAPTERRKEDHLNNSYHVTVEPRREDSKAPEHH